MGEFFGDVSGQCCDAVIKVPEYIKGLKCSTETDGLVRLFLYVQKKWFFEDLLDICWTKQFTIEVYR